MAVDVMGLVLIRQNLVCIYICKKADLIIWDHDESNVKIGAGRLIELIKSTLNQKSIDNLHSSHALIITNKNNITYDDVIKISVDIQSKVYKEFNINLEIEPTII